ncbi:MAG: DoxX family protein [Candidatus Sulfotelmatobacter sp.]
MSKPFTIFLGIAEVAGGLGLAFGVLTQLAAFGLILIMLGAILKKIFAWHTGLPGWESLRLALRPDLRRDEAGHRLHQRRRVRVDAMSRTSGTVLLLHPFGILFYAGPTLKCRFTQEACIA